LGTPKERDHYAESLRERGKGRISGGAVLVGVGEFEGGRAIVKGGKGFPPGKQVKTLEAQAKGNQETHSWNKRFGEKMSRVFTRFTKPPREITAPEQEKKIKNVLKGGKSRESCRNLRVGRKGFYSQRHHPMDIPPTTKRRFGGRLKLKKRLRTQVPGGPDRIKKNGSYLTQDGGLAGQELDGRNRAV